jgi:hypothetical protein
VRSQGNSRKKSIRAVVILVIGVLIGVAIVLMQAPSPPSQPLPPSRTSASTATSRDAPRVTAMPDRESRPITSAKPPRAATETAPALPFAFLGKVTTDGATSIVLYGNGRTIKVKGPGPLDDRYDVESIADDHMVLLYKPLGQRQTLELAARQPVLPGSPEDSERD